MRFDDEPEVDDVETIEAQPVDKKAFEEGKNYVDFRVEMAKVHTDKDVSSFPQNPYGDRPTKNNSLFFDDGLRSVDFVLVWKKLVPSDDDERSDVLRQRELDDIHRKEAERVERRDVYEESLIHEGLELEREIVDEEIHFVKVHAPLEVLRRYAEILKLRLPMKEVSHVIFSRILWFPDVCDVTNKIFMC